jgi:hypothetical protein
MVSGAEPFEMFEVALATGGAGGAPPPPPPPPHAAITRAAAARAPHLAAQQFMGMGRLKYAIVRSLNTCMWGEEILVRIFSSQGLCHSR